MKSFQLASMHLLNSDYVLKAGVNAESGENPPLPDV